MNPVITKIEPQKKNKNRFSIYSDNEFIIGISDEELHGQGDRGSDREGVYVL